MTADKHPLWCADHRDGDHRTSARLIRLSGPEHATARAFAVQYFRDEAPSVIVAAGSINLLEQWAYVKIRDARAAEEMAVLLERLATAAPTQMRDLAAQVRAAAAAFSDREVRDAI